MLMFIGWWALTIMIALTLAGEKMPWLTPALYLVSVGPDRVETMILRDPFVA